MVKRTKANETSETVNLNENEALALREDFSQLFSTRNSKSKDNAAGDDLIVSLSNAYENKRARQVFEWDRLARQNVQPIQRAI